MVVLTTHEPRVAFGVIFFAFSPFLRGAHGRSFLSIGAMTMIHDGDARAGGGRVQLRGQYREMGARWGPRKRCGLPERFFGGETVRSTRWMDGNKSDCTSLPLLTFAQISFIL